MSADESTVAVGPAPVAAQPTRGERLRMPPWQYVTYWLAMIASVVLVLAVYGFLPGMSEVPLRATYSTGMLTCLHDQGMSSLWKWCMETGRPIGAPELTGWVELHIGWLLTYLPGVTPWRANHLTSAMVVTAGFAGTLLILRRWSAPRWIAVLASVSYLVGPNLLQLNGFVYTIDGYLLVPAYVYLGMLLLDRMERGSWVTGAAGAFLLGFAMTFTDGYSFFGGAVVLAFLVLARCYRLARSERLRSALAMAVLWLGAMGVPTAVYTLWVPGGAYESAAVMDNFALYGVDLATLLVPSTHYLYPSLLGFRPPAMAVWGTNATPLTNYLGYLMAILAVVGVVVVLRRRWRVRGEVLAVLAALVVTLVLALGPSLKIDQMQAGINHSLLRLPTSWLYEHVPGMSSMRATNRWLVVTRLCLVVLCGLGLTALWNGWRRHSRVRGAGIVLVALLAVAEVLPNTQAIVDERKESIARVDYLNSGIVAESDRLLHHGETVLMLPSVNDFLADYLIPLVGVRSYNVGIDKNHALALASWPAVVRAANDAYGKAGFADKVCAVLQRHTDAVVLPYMDTRNGPLLFGNDPATEQQRQKYAASIASDKRFNAVVGRWITVLRARPGGPCSQHS